MAIESRRRNDYLKQILPTVLKETMMINERYSPISIY